MLASFDFAQQLTPRTFSRVVNGRCESQSASAFEVCWQVLALHSSSLFARFLESSMGDMSPRVRVLSRSAGKFWLCIAAHSSHVFSGRRRHESQSARTFEFCWQVLALHCSSLFARFLGSSMGDVSPRVRVLSRSASKFWLCTAAPSSRVFSGRRRAMSSIGDVSPRV
ncbi:hypothetical protein PanWU01x14_021300 [Parasponia andersonii]|uniref:Uncharacterized protein n=1 Tax=Parasponia andersonii TaxID=3476 RepID=A0A2P5DXX7_PARAD|nr:hypothetical protein PanWU01x14_021300 [Parasponia andersonii]